jgi:hypothetical protein
MAVVKKEPRSASKKRAKSGSAAAAAAAAAASTPKVRRATMLSVATPSSNRHRVLEERVDGHRVHDEYDGRELYLPLTRRDSARTTPVSSVVRSTMLQWPVSADDVDFVKPPVQCCSATSAPS